MISSETKILLKRSGIPGRVPSLADLKLGELGINYNDGKIFLRQENEVVGARIIEPGQGDVIGKTIFVSVEGNDNNSGLNERDAKRSIKAAAAIATPGDSIKVYPGQYIEDNPIIFQDRVSVEGMELRNVLVTPANPGEDLYLVGDGFHATNHSFVSNQDSTDGAAIISFRRLEGTASDRYFDAARLIRDNLDFIASETVGFLTSGYSGYAAGQRSQDAARAIELNKDFITEEAFQYINSPDYRGPGYVNPDINQCRRDLGNILDGWQYDLISDGNSETTGVGLTYYAPIPYVNSANIVDLLYDNNSGNVVIETDLATQVKPGDKIKLQDIKLDCGPYGNEFLISGFDYDKLSGVGTVSLPFFHDINVGDTIKLDGLKFECPPYGAQSFDIINVNYEETTGSAIITLTQPHSLSSGDKIELRNIQFDCPAYGGDFTNILDFEYDESNGRGVVYFEDAVNLSPGDTVQLYDIKFDCPPYGNDISITDFIYDNFTGQSEVTLASSHGLQLGDLVKLEDLRFTCNSYLEDSYEVSNFVYNNLTGDSVVTLSRDHSFVTGDKVELRDLVFQCNSYIPTGIEVTDFVYDSTTGESTISLHEPHNLQIGDNIRLQDIAFACNSYSFSTLDVVSAFYDNATGFVTIEVDSPHGQILGSNVRLSNLEYSCSNSGITTTLFPDGTYGYDFEILSVPSPTSFILNVGTSTIDHSYVSGGTATVGITTTVFPDGTQGYDFTVEDLVDEFTIVTNVGVSTIAHSYAGGGTLFVGFTTTFFPDGTQGYNFEVTNIPTPNQIELNVGVSSIQHGYVSGGTVSTIDNFIDVTGLVYDESQGTGTVSLSRPHNLVAGDNFILQDLKFACDSYRAGVAGTFGITSFIYDGQTGLSTITLDSAHDINASDSIALYDINFTCPNGSGISTTVFPDGSRDNLYSVVATPDPNTIITRVGQSSIPHTYNGGGVLQVGITTNIFPDGTRPSGEFFRVISTPSPTEIETQIGVSSIAHAYVSGGKFYTGITTNIFPQKFTDPNVEVVSADYSNLTGVVEITTNKAHGLEGGDPVLLQGLEFSCTSGGPNNTPGSLIFPRNQEVYNVLAVISPTVYTVDVGTSAFAHTYVKGGISTPENITDAVYNNANGELTVTLSKQHGYNKGDKASVTDLLFQCNSGGINNQPGTLLFPRPSDEFVVLSVTGNSLTVNVGAFPGLVHTYVNGGSLKYSGTTVAVTDATYDEITGIVNLTTAAPLGAPVDATIVMQGLEFSCLSGGPGNDPGKIIFPRLDVPFFPVTEIINDLTYVINVGTSSLTHTYVSGGFSTLKKRDNDNNLFKVIGIPAPNKIVTTVGVSSIPHTYVSGGNAFVGITTNIFPDGTRPEGYTFEVLSSLTENSIVIDIGSSTIPHNYESGGRMQYGETNERKVIDFQYTNKTGLSTVTVRGVHGLSAGDNVKFEGLEFTCSSSPGITTNIFPDGTAASYNIFPVERIINNNTFECNVGRVDFEHTYLRGGSAFVGVTTNIFPDGTRGYDFIVDDVISDTQLSVNVGVSSITHEYLRGGSLFSGRTNQRDIADFTYNNVDGSAILTFRAPEPDLFTGDFIKLEGLQFNCPNSTGITTNIFPDGSIGNIFPITQRLSPTQYELNVAPSSFEHIYVRGTGAAFVGITTDIFPDLGSQDSKLFRVVGVPTPNKVAVQVGPSSITHTYKSGGRLSTGINTDTFPGNSVVSPLGDVFTVNAITNSGEILINVGVSTIEHNYIPGWSGGQVLYGQSLGGELQHITGPGVKDATIAAIDFERQISKYALNNRPWGSFIAAETSLVDQFQYDNTTGLATITSQNINVQAGDLVRMSDIQFRCSDEYAGLTTTFFPDNTRPEGQYFNVDRRIDENTFETVIGLSTIPHTYLKGGNVYRYRQSVNDVIYNNISGIASVTSLDHGFNVGDKVELGDIRFDCPVFNPDYTIENFEYDNETGLSTVTTTIDNDIEVGDLVKLADIRLKCPPYGNDLSISNFDYSNVTGVASVTTLEPHGISLNKRTPVGVVTASYDNISGIITVTVASDIDLKDLVNEGIVLNDLEFSCDSVPPGITTTIFPEQNYVYSVDELLSSTEFSVQVGASTIPHAYESGGFAVKVDKSDVRLANIKMDCPPYGNDIDITNFLYDNTSGNSLVTVDAAHGLSVGDSIKLTDIKFQCTPYDNKFSVIAADYDTVSGIVTVTTANSLGELFVGDKVRLKGLQFDCNSGTTYGIDNILWEETTRTVTFRLDQQPVGLQVGDSIKITDLNYRIPSDPGGTFPRQYPDGRDNSLNLFTCSFVAPDISFPGFWLVESTFVNLSEADIQFQQSNGDLTVGITTNIYPDTTNQEGGIYDVLAIPAANQVTVGVGSTAIAHNYVRFGDVFTGVTTNFFPSPEAQNSPKGNIFPVLDIPAPNQVRINVGVSSIVHSYDSGGSLLVGVTTNIFPSPDRQNSPSGDILPVLDVVDTNTVIVRVGQSSIPHNYVSGGQMLVGITTDIFPGDLQNSPRGDIFEVLFKDNECGKDRFTVNVGPSSIPHNYVEGGTVTTGVTTNRFPDGTNGFEFEILNVIDADKFQVNVGPSSIQHNYISGGFARRLEFPIENYVYENTSGLATVTAKGHRLNVGDIVKLRDIKFDCDPYGGEKTIVGVEYNNIIGSLVVTTQESHGLAINDSIKLSGIQMDCEAYGNEIGINAGSYNNVTGELFLQTSQPHGLNISDSAKLDGLFFDCINSGITTNIFPDGTAASYNIFPVASIGGVDSLTLQVGVSSIVHQYVNGTGSLFVGVTTNIFPGSKRNSPKGSFYEVLDIPAINQFTVDVGVSSITHNYVRGGLVQAGVTTDIFPDGTQGEFFVVEDVLDQDNFIVNSGISSIVHRYNSGGYASKYATYQSKTPQVIDMHVIRAKGDCKAVEARVDQLAGIVTSILNEGPEAAPGGSSVEVSGSSYNNVTGDLLINTLQPSALKSNDIVKIENLIFQCQKIASVSGASYDNRTGVTKITTSTPHGLEVGGDVLLEGLEFACNDGSLIYPADPTRALTVSNVVDKYTYEMILDTSLKIHTYVTGGTSTSVPTSRIFPDNKVLDYRVKSVQSPTSFIVNVGGSDLPHTYISGGTVQLGLRFNVTAAEFDNKSGEVTITTDEDNYFVANTGVQLNALRFQCPSGGTGNQPGNLLFPDGRAANVTSSTYDNETGLLRVTTDKPHQVYRDAKVRLEGLEFACNDGSLIYPSNPNQLLRVTGVENEYTYQVQLSTSGKVHTYVRGGTSDAGTGNYRIKKVVDPRTFVVQMAPNNIPHTFLGGGTAASVFTQQELIGINLRTNKCADDVKKIYLAVAHDITRGGNWKSVEAGKRYYDAVGQYQHIAGGEVSQTVDALDFSLNIVRCVINNVSWGGVPRGYFNGRERQFIPTSTNPNISPTNAALSRDLLRLVDMPPSTSRSVVGFQRAYEKGQYTTTKKFIENFDYNNVTGIASVTTTQAHRLIKYDAIRIEDVQMRCVGSPRITTNMFPDGTQGEIFEVIDSIQDNPIYPINDANYDNTTGRMVVQSLGSDLDISVGTLINLRYLRFECSSAGFPGTLIFPTNKDFLYEVLERPTSDTLVVNVGVSSLAHTFVPISTGIDVPQLQELPRKFTVHVGTVNFPHIYEQGGSVWKMEPFSTPETATQLRDVSIQDDPLQFTNSTPNACANVFSAIENAVGVVTTIIDVGFDASGISTTFPGNDGKGVPTMDLMSSQGVGNIIKGPYIRNCTNFVPKSIGMRMDGFDAEPGDEISNGVQGSSNVDSFTQFNPGGIGCSISNGTYQQLVSIFTICCDEAIVCDSGAQLDLTNSNSSFGRLGLVARGIGDAKSKCIDRYTGIVAEEAEIEDDTVIIRGVGNKRPYDGQGIYFGELFREVVRIDVIDGGSGYDDENPPNAFVAIPTGPSGIKAEVSPTVTDGVVTSIELISNGNQYRDLTPTVTIDPPKDPSGRQAKAVTVTEPLYYDVDSSSEPTEGTVRVVFKQRLNNTVSVGTTVFFSRLSLQIASSHSFEYIGAGNEIDGARPSQGGVPIKENEVVKVDGGSIVYTSTDQAGNFNIGDDFVINQFTGTVTGRSFDQSVLNKVTPLIIALDS